MDILQKVLGLNFSALGHWGYFIIFLVVLLETTPLFGSFIPGQTIVIFGGLLAKLGVLDIGDVMWVVALGAILGDFLAYYLGHKYGYSLLKGRKFIVKAETIEKAKALVKEHPAKAIMIGRLNSVTRAFVPFVAGASKLDIKKFAIYNVIGSVLYAVCFVLLGYIFGHSFELIAKYTGRYVLIGIILIVAIIYAYRFVQKRKHIFTKYNLYELILIIFSIWLVSNMIEGILAAEKALEWDVWVHAHMSTIVNAKLTGFMAVITWLGSWYVLVPVSIATFIILILRKKIYHAVLFPLAMFSGLAFELLLKIIIRRARPDGGLVASSGFSFPSGHATMSALYFCLLLYMFKDDIKTEWGKYIFIAANILLFLLVGFSRIYLSVHWTSDVLAGWGIAFFWLSFWVLTLQSIMGFSKWVAGLLGFGSTETLKKH